MPEVSVPSGEVKLPPFVPVEDFTDVTTGYKFLIGKIFVAHILLLRHDDTQVFMLRLMLHCVKIDVGLGYRPLVQEELLGFEWRLFNTIGTHLSKQMS